MSLAPFGSAKAQQADARLSAIEQQIKALQDELRHVRHDLAEKDKEVRASRSQSTTAPQVQGEPPTQIVPVIPPGYALVPAAPGSKPGSVVLAQTVPPGPPLPKGTIRLGDGAVSITFGGFIEAAGIYRSRNEVADIASNWNTGIPLPNSVLYHENELRGSARQTRFSFLAQGDPDPVTHLAAYIEADFLGAAPTANNNESNSYNPRLRHGYLTYDRSDLDLQILAGQEWSLLTMDRTGIVARKENIPLTIDAQYVPGFTWARQPQLRFSKAFDDNLFSAAVSLESPQTVYAVGPNGAAPASVGTVNIVNPGGMLYAPTSNYSTEVAPDLIAKVAVDPSFGHFEAYGVVRFEHDRVSVLGRGNNNTIVAAAGGAAAYVPIFAGYLDFQASVLAGDGIGRYGTSGLPDATIGRDGSPKPLSEYQALAGLIGHPIPSISVYSYIGTEQTGKSSFASGGKAYGYGSPLYSNATCGVELGAAATCIGNTSGIVQGTIGSWWQFLKGDYGTMQIGAQYSYTQRSVFQGIGPTPSTDLNTVLLSFRYYPFQ